jgi:hypothetical protein
VIKFGQRTEEVGCSTHFIPDDQATLACTLDFEDLDDGTVARLNIRQDALIDFKGILGRLFKEYGVRYSADVGLAIGEIRWGRVRGEVALGHEIATQLLMCSGRDRTDGTICFETVAIVWSGIVKVEFVDSRRCIREFWYHGLLRTRDQTHLGSTCEPGPSEAVKPGALV